MGRKALLSDEEKKRRRNENSKKWNREHKNKVLAANKKWREENRAKWNQYCNEYQKKKWAEDPEFRQKKTEVINKWHERNAEITKVRYEEARIRRSNKKPELKDDWLYGDENN